MTTAVVTINGARTAPPTVLGQGQVRIPTGGKIRAGIKVLTRKAAENSKAKAIYDKGVNENRSFEDIEREITQAFPELKTPLVPKNVPWFTVRPDDFPNGQIARQILETFGEDRGDGVKRLYRFPVVFPADMWQAVMPHQLVTWGASDKKFWSEYSLNGQVRYCKCYAPVPMDDSGKRAIRIFGGRKTILRHENQGLCEPEACREYQNRQCNLSGRFVFFIPGIKSLDAFELHTNSFYAMNAAIQKFETIAFMRGGRISGFLDNKQTSFFITKKLMEVPHIDEEGRAVRVKHWIIELEAPVDVTAVLGAKEEIDTTIINAARAARLLEAPAVPGAEILESVEGAAPSREASPSREPEVAEGAREAHVVQENTSILQEKPHPAIQSNAEPTQAHATAQSVEAQGGSSAAALQQITNAAAEFGIESERYLQYAAKRWGTGWKMNPIGRRRALEEIERFRDNPDGLVTKIKAELNDFA